MTKLSLKSNELNSNKKNFKIFNSNDNISKEKYLDKIKYLVSLEIKDEVVTLLIYLCDFIIYDNLEQLLINGGYLNEYSCLIMFKEMIQEKEFKINENAIALSERKYQRHQIERLYNKFYFKLYKIEEIKNSRFGHIKNNNFNNFKLKTNLIIQK